MGKLQGNAASSILPSSPSATKTSAPSNTIFVPTGRIPYKVPLLTLETTVTQAPSQSSKPGGISGGAAAGIVIGILILAAIGGGAFIYFRRRRKVDYQKQYSYDSSPGSLNRPFRVDQRLEPGMVQKRESVGSLADEQDYSRKILRVPPIKDKLLI